MRRVKKNKLLPLILLLLLVMTIGFAYLRTSLSINGSASFKGNTWNIYFDNIQVKNGSVTPVTEPTIPADDKTTISFEVDLNLPGEYYEFTVDVVNDGTIDAMIDTFFILPELTDTQKKYIEYDVRYDNGSKIKVHDLLRAESSETLRVKLKYKNDLNPEDLPSSPDIITPSVTIVYVQATEEASEVLPPPTLMAAYFDPEIEATGANVNNEAEVLLLGDLDNDLDILKFDIGEARDWVKKVIFERGIAIPDDAIEIWDVGVNQNRDVMAYLILNEDDSTMYDLHIQSYDDLYANEDMSNWFRSYRNVESITGLELLNTSNVTDMSYMFSSAGKNATTFDIGNLGNWDTANVTDMSYMFWKAGLYATNWSIGDLSNWDTSNVIVMEQMFEWAGRLSTTWSVGDLSNWDVSSVTSMYSMFDDAGVYATTFDIGDLSNWDVSNVTDMSYMFYNAGYKANYHLDLSKWNVNNVTDYFNFNVYVESKVIPPVWVN